MENSNNEKELQSSKKTNNESIDEEINSNLGAIKEELEEQSEQGIAREDANESQCDCNQEISQKNKEIMILKQELEEYKNRYMRVSADFQNYKRRVEKEKNDIYKFGSEKIIIDLLPIVDNLERAIQSSEKNENEVALKDGIQMIYEQFINTLKKHGVEEIESLGKEFNPLYHHAVMQEECDDKESNIVVDVYQKGYMLNSKVIRPSMVKVSK